MEPFIIYEILMKNNIRHTRVLCVAFKTYTETKAILEDITDDGINAFIIPWQYRHQLFRGY